MAPLTPGAAPVTRSSASSQKKNNADRNLAGGRPGRVTRSTAAFVIVFTQQTLEIDTDGAPSSTFVRSAWMSVRDLVRMSRALISTSLMSTSIAAEAGIVVGIW
jgi:hypothetical protein